MNKEFYSQSSFQIAKYITKRYSTSFSLATSLMDAKTRKAIYAIYGFVRLADEIVDSFNGYNQEFLLNNLEEQFFIALEQKISSNVIINAFTETVLEYNISTKYIKAFISSMRADLSKQTYNSKEELDEYIYGSADVVGLMCLQIFCNGNSQEFERLAPAAKSLGSAFQKVNFLRDLQSDIDNLGRTYFPELKNNNLNTQSKIEIEKNIENDFINAKQGIDQLPGRSKLAVALAYKYYIALFNKIKKSNTEKLINQRIRINNIRKYYIFSKTIISYFLGCKKL